MVDVRFAALLGLAGCYAPDLRDCVVACTSSADCASEHVCGTDGFCATAERAGHCAALRDSGADGVDRDAPDSPHADAHVADAPPDAARHVMLTVDVGGMGTVDVGTLGTCAPPPACMYSVIAAAPIALVAQPATGQEFDKWDGPCDHQMATCTIAPLMNVKVTAHFRKLD
jgi:hypothetical protein